MLDSLFIFCSVCKPRKVYTLAVGAYQGDDGKFHPFCDDCLRYELPEDQFVFYFSEKQGSETVLLKAEREICGV